jgi:hypothetical protein
MKIKLSELKQMIHEAILKEMEEFEVSPQTMAGATPPAPKPGKGEHLSGTVPQKQTDSSVFAKALLDLLNRKGTLKNPNMRDKLVKDLGISPEEIDAAINKIQLEEQSLQEMVKKLVTEAIEERFTKKKK